MEALKNEYDNKMVTRPVEGGLLLKMSGYDNTQFVLSWRQDATFTA